MLSLLNPGWIGVFLGALGVAFGIYQVIRRTGARLTYQFMGQRLIEDGGGLLPNEVVVQYDGKKVPRVSLSQIVVWNAGRAAVRSEDIASKQPIRFSFGSDAEILKAEVAKHTRAANNSTASVENKSRNVLRYDFSFLDRHDGALIRVLHTGTKTRPDCSGTIIGVPKGVEYLGRIPVGLYRYPLRFRSSDSFLQAFGRTVLLMMRFRRTIYLITGIFGLAILTAAILPGSVVSFLFGTAPSYGARAAMITVGIIYGFVPLFSFWTERRRFPASLLPDEIADDRDVKQTDESASE